MTPGGPVWDVDCCDRRLTTFLAGSSLPFFFLLRLFSFFLSFATGCPVLSLLQFASNGEGIGAPTSFRPRHAAGAVLIQGPAAMMQLQLRAPARVYSPDPDWYIH
jgi:hypothetical protein